MKVTTLQKKKLTRVLYFHAAMNATFIIHKSHQRKHLLFKSTPVNQQKNKLVGKGQKITKLVLGTSVR